MRTVLDSVRIDLLARYVVVRTEMGAESIEWLVMVSVLVSLLSLLMGVMVTQLPPDILLALKSMLQQVIACPPSPPPAGCGS